MIDVDTEDLVRKALVAIAEQLEGETARGPVTARLIAQSTFHMLRAWDSVERSRLQTSLCVDCGLPQELHGSPEPPLDGALSDHWFHGPNE